VYSICWNNCFQAVAVCSFSAYAPIRVLCFDAGQPQVVLNPPQQQGAAAAAARKQRKSQVRRFCSDMPVHQRSDGVDDVVDDTIPALWDNIPVVAAHYLACST
jgi:hypothetical protein